MQHQSQNNMITPIDKIPLKTSGANITEDMTDDPIVKDVLNEFEKELSLNEQTIKNNYLINNNQHQQQQPPQNYQQPLYHPLQQQLQPQLQQQQSSKINYIDNELITKSFIICIVIAIIINPVIYNTILSKIPENISGIFDNYNYIIKIILIFIALYALMFYKLL
jgi:hypothetical protein